MVSPTKETSMSYRANKNFLPIRQTDCGDNDPVKLRADFARGIINGNVHLAGMSLLAMDDADALWAHTLALKDPYVKTMVKVHRKYSVARILHTVLSNIHENCENEEISTWFKDNPPEWKEKMLSRWMGLESGITETDQVDLEVTAKLV
jgi:hypothetical protein